MNANLKPSSTGQRKILPSRADHVGSFLRPKYLPEARVQFGKGQITAAQLRLVTEVAREVWGGE
jgi:5-methyltetrahydropteroyltriglutamate--homocysteine methyltransferase